MALGCETKLQSAKYHLERVKDSYLGDREHLESEVSSFLADARSVRDFMLEDLNKKLSLGIPLAEEDFIRIIRGKSKSNRDVGLFFNWYDAHLELMLNDTAYRFLIGRTGLRNIGVHRKPTIPPLRGVMKMTSNACFKAESDSTMNGDQTAEREADNKIEASQPLAQNEGPKSDLFFMEYYDLNIMEACQRVFDLTEEFVRIGRQKFFS